MKIDIELSWTKVVSDNKKSTSQDLYNSLVILTDKPVVKQRCNTSIVNAITFRDINLN